MAQKVARRRVDGFSITAVAVGTLVTTTLFAAPQFSSIQEYFAVRAAASELVENLKETQRLTVGHDVDRRIRLTSERGYVREKRAGAGWLFEQAFVMPDGMELFGPPVIEFQSHSTLSPVALYTITGPNLVRREIVMKKNGVIAMK